MTADCTFDSVGGYGSAVLANDASVVLKQVVLVNVVQQTTSPSLTVQDESGSEDIPEIHSSGVLVAASQQASIAAEVCCLHPSD